MRYTPFLVLIALALYSLSAESQITYKGFGKSNIWIQNPYNNDMYFIEDTTVGVTDIAELFAGDRKFANSFFMEDGYRYFKKNKSFVISNVKFIESDNETNYNDKFLMSTTEKFDVDELRFQNCYFEREFDYPEIRGSINSLWGNRFSSFQLRGHRDLSILAERNSFEEIIGWNVNSEAFVFTHIKAENKLLKVNFSGSKFERIMLSFDSVASVSLDFHADSINGFGIVDTSAKHVANINQHFSGHYFSCYINGNYKVSIEKKRSKIVFEQCTFGPDAKFLRLECDSVEFNKCNFTSPIYLEFGPTKTYLSFPNTNTSNIKFDFTDNVKLYFDSATHKDWISSTYENLLSKFKAEGKLEGYRNIDIAYQEYQLKNDGFFGKMVALLNKVWWNFGYNKGYIVYWTITLVIFFYLINTILWKHMLLVYPLISPENFTRKQKESNLKYFLRKQLSILIYTSYIFFSLKVDFNKLEYKSSRLLLWFFLQYIVGLFCLFFIANAILKLG